MEMPALRSRRWLRSVAVRRIVSISERQQGFIAQCGAEVGGGSSDAFLAIAGRDNETIGSALQDLRSSAEASTAMLSEPTWRVLYDAVNAAIYSLGPSELTTITGFTLDEAADVQLQICSGVWGAYGGARWDVKPH